MSEFNAENITSSIFEYIEILDGAYREVKKERDELKAKYEKLRDAVQKRKDAMSKEDQIKYELYRASIKAGYTHGNECKCVFCKH